MSEFHRRRARPDGRQSNCKTCNVALSNGWRCKNLEQAAAIARRWRLTRPDYHATHKWLNRHYTKSGACGNCRTKGLTEWANISGTYRRDIADFEELCVPCHRSRDAERRDQRIAA